MSLLLPAEATNPPSSAITDSLIRVRDIGFTTLYGGGPYPELDIIFIHGIQGHPYNTWCHAIEGPRPARSKSNFLGIHRSRSRNASEGAESPNLDPSPGALSGFWPAEILPEDFPDARILTYGYDSHVSHFFGGAANQNDIVTIGSGFLNDIAAERRDAWKRPLIIVSHSMGGLITKEALRRASAETKKNADLRDVLKSTIALIFLGTPHRGGAYTDMALTATKIAKAAGFDVNDRNIRDLRGNSPLLTLIRQSFVRLLDSDEFQVSTFQESLGYKGTGLLNGKIVPDESSELGHRNERVHHINANHMNMCRFKDRQDDGYRKFQAEITRHVSNLRDDAEPKCINSFLIPQMNDRESQIEKAHEETLSWIYDEPGPGIATWLRSGKGVFWIQGKPGSGKSTAMKFMLQDKRTSKLLNSGAEGEKFQVIGCFFTDRGERVQASWYGILHSMLYQLLSGNPEALRLVLPTWKELKRLQVIGKPLWDLDNAERMLRILLNQSDQRLKICFLIDAIDEHDGNHTRMCDFLHEICNYSSKGAVFKVCAASRPENELRDLFRSDSTIEIHNWTNGDIQRFISKKFSSHPRWKALLDGRGADIAARIEQDIASRAKGVFLWVRLIIDELLEGLTNGNTLRELELQTSEFPDDLNDFFAHILLKVDKKYHAELIMIIEALVRSRAPLTAAFLQVVIIVNLQEPNEGALLSDLEIELEIERTFDREGFSRRLQSRCRGLVEMVTAEDHLVVQFLHQTVKEYFLETENLSRISRKLREKPRYKDPASLSGHTFLLKGILEVLRFREIVEGRQTDRFRVECFGYHELKDIAAEIVYHISQIETKFKTSPMHILRDLDDAVTQISSCGDLWPFDACGMCSSLGGQEGRVNMALRTYMEQKRLPPRHYLLMLAISMGWTNYIQQATSLEDTSSIRTVGVRQFSYLCCPIMMKGAIPPLDSSKFLVDAQIDVAKCQEVRNGHQVDALGFFISSHLPCLTSESLHLEVINFLLECGANPRGKCLVYRDRIDKAFELGTNTEALMTYWGLRESLNIIELLEAYCPKSDVLAAELFDTSPGKVFESRSLRHGMDKDTFTWLYQNGAYISDSLALIIYRPLAKALQLEYDGEMTYSEALQSCSETEEEDPAAQFDKDLINTFESATGKEISSSYRFLLEPEQRQARFYSAAARRLVAAYNPQWSKEEIEAEDSSEDNPIPDSSLPNFLGLGYWKKFLPTRNIA